MIFLTHPPNSILTPAKSSQNWTISIIHCYRILAHSDLFLPLSYEMLFLGVRGLEKVFFFSMLKASYFISFQGVYNCLLKVLFFIGFAFDYAFMIVFCMELAMLPCAGSMATPHSKSAQRSARWTLHLITISHTVHYVYVVWCGVVVSALVCWLETQRPKK